MHNKGRQSRWKFPLIALQPLPTLINFYNVKSTPRFAKSYGMRFKASDIVVENIFDNTRNTSQIN